MIRNCFFFYFEHKSEHNSAAIRFSSQWQPLCLNSVFKLWLRKEKSACSLSLLPSPYILVKVYPGIYKARTKPIANYAFWNTEVYNIV
jgi:hypothetical protein